MGMLQNWALENPNFRKWFGNSVVVDEHGLPLINKHGTYTPENAEPFHTFAKTSDVGFHSGTADQAAEKARTKALGHHSVYMPPDKGYPGETIYPLYVSIQKPLHTSDLGGWYPDKWISELENISAQPTVNQGITPRMVNELKDELAANREIHGHYSENNLQVIKNKLKDWGFDGVVYMNTGEGKEPARSYIAFEPTQLKSPFNQGTFSPTEGNILKGAAGLMAGAGAMGMYDMADAADIRNALAWKSATPSKFVSARDVTTRPEFLTPYATKDLEGLTVKMLKDDAAGYVVKPDGDIVNVFNNGKKGVDNGAAAVIDAIRNGGNKLDFYDSHLTNFYKSLGFKETGRDKFNPDFAPDWVKKYGAESTPDIIYMEYGGNQNDPTHAIRMYEAERARRSATQPTGTGISSEVNLGAGGQTRQGVGAQAPEALAGQPQGGISANVMKRGLLAATPGMAQTAPNLPTETMPDSSVPIDWNNLMNLAIYGSPQSMAARLGMLSGDLALREIQKRIPEVPGALTNRPDFGMQ